LTSAARLRQPSPALAGLFAYPITRAGIPEQIGTVLKETLRTSELFRLGVNAAPLVIGMFIETSAAIIVLAPILAPVAAHFGIDPVHVGTVMIVILAPGMITPPFGVDLFAACSVAEISLDRIVTRLLPFVGVVLACLLVSAYVPLLTLPCAISNIDSRRPLRRCPRHVATWR
jgi:TRAP-type C4-dicarboxylate transport system permease large subunit